MHPRYSKPEMTRHFTDVAKWDAVLDVELAAIRARSDLGQIPEADAIAILQHAPRITEAIIAQIAEREAVTDHDVAAFVDVLAEAIGGDEARWFHYGLTSSDVTDTALCRQLTWASDTLIAAGDVLLTSLCRRAREFATTPCAGRTHGQHAEIITFGVRIANWAHMVDRALATLRLANQAIQVGKLSGACGTYSNIDPEVERLTCENLALTPVVATQVIPRDLHLDLLHACSKLGNAIGHIYFNLRLMAITEIGEVEEGRRPGQKGSSAMPHKRNPIKGEQLDGLARTLRGYYQMASQDVELLFERDISHSAPERIYLPDALTLTHYMTVTATSVFDLLVVNSSRMRLNIERGLGLMYTQTALTALIDDGWQRDDAYRCIQRLASRAIEENRPLSDLLVLSDEAHTGIEQLQRIFSEAHMLRNTHLIIESLPR